MESSGSVTVVGVFPSKSKADRARRSLHARETLVGRVSLLSPRQSSPVNIRKELEPASFSVAQMHLLAEQQEHGRTFLIVESNGPINDISGVLAEHGAVHIEISGVDPEQTQSKTLPLYEEQLKIDKGTRHVGEVIVRKVLEEIPAQAEVEALHEELDVEHVSVGKIVSERRGPWREGDVLVIPVYEEQFTVVRQVVMREQLRVRLHQVREKHTLADTVRREHVVIDDPDGTGRVNVHHRGPEVAANNESTTSEHTDA